MPNRIYVKTEQFEGWATVIEHFPDEIFPIQIELDEPDSDGHAVKRVAKSDIVKKEAK